MSAEAQELLSLAVEAENCGNIQTAFETYQCALNLLFEDAKKENDENKKGSLHRIIGKYMDIAESLKKQLDANKMANVSSTSTTNINKTSPTSVPSSSNQSSSTVFNATNVISANSTQRPSLLSRPSSSGNVTSNTTTNSNNNNNVTNANTKANSTGTNKQQQPQQPKPDHFDYTIGGRVVKPKHPPILPSMSSTVPNKHRMSTASAAAAVTSSTPTNKPAIPATARGNTSHNSTATATSSSSTSNTDATNRQKLKNSSGQQTSDKDVNTNNKLSEYESQIQNDMLDKSPGVTWDDIAGLAFAKQTLQEAVILPNLRPDLFTGLRAPPRGVLLFGPPGTGKTLLAKAVATESGFVFFSITASSVTSKYLGEGEKLMKGLFSVARRLEPAVIFLDEIDSLMSARKENEHEASRRVKTEFMTQADGATTGQEERLLIMGATNIPWELDEAVLRRLVKRIYVPLPDNEARRALIKHQIMKHYKLSQKQLNNLTNGSSSGDNSNTKNTTSFVNLIFGDTRATSSSSSGSGGNLTSPSRSSEIAVPGFTEADLTRIVALTVNYSGSDLTAVCHEAAMGPIRELGFAALKTVKAEDVRPLLVKDFETAVLNIRPSVSPDSLQAYVKWGDQFGVTK